MLTRLRVKNFKNLVDVDLRFGPFTCIAGANGVGKSNLFDAIRFLSFLAERPLLEAALAVRAESNHTGDVRSLFHRVGDRYAETIEFAADIIIPATGIDDLGQTAKASITLLRYEVILAYKSSSTLYPSDTLELQHEKLIHLNIGDAPKHLRFEHEAKTWRKSLVKGRRTSPFISTDDEDGRRVVKLHQDGNQGRPRSLLASDLPRTVLSATDAAESPTALLARREMQSWRVLQLEPSSLRQPDNFTAPTHLGTDGSHLASTLYYLAQTVRHQAADEDVSLGAQTQLYAQVANRLSGLLDGVRELWVDRDEARQLLTIMVETGDRTIHPARSLSDGTLRFLALAVLDLDPDTRGLICLEEPENGVHPARIPNILQLLQDVAVDPEEEVGSDNPLRQVIVNTHSPVVVQQIPDDSLLIADIVTFSTPETRRQAAHFRYLKDTWRTNTEEHDSSKLVSREELSVYLNPVPPEPEGNGYDPATSKTTRKRPSRRIIDRPDLQPFIPGFHESFRA